MRFLLTTALALSLGATAQTTMTMPADQVFVTKAGEGNLFEINAAKIALRLGKAQAVKDFAQKMVTDHTKLGDDVKAAVAGTGLQVPTTVSPDQQKMLDALKTSGAAFDATYRQMMVQSHYDTYTVFQSYTKVGQTPALKTVIAGALPVVKMHWDMALALPRS